jgi:serine O-acetyltransferase
MPRPASPAFRAFAAELHDRRESLAIGLQLKHDAQRFADELLAVLFPHFCRERFASAGALEARLVRLEDDLARLIAPLLPDGAAQAGPVASGFFGAVPDIHERLLRDAEAIEQGDPAAESLDEVVLAYPGFLAIAIHRLAHALYGRVPIFPRVLTEYAHQMTGIDIHPGASIGESFAIDHGTGVVIGESAVIGRNVKLYQGVTLGALSVEKRLAKSKRHPTIEDNVVVYAQAVILGGETTVGHDSIIGGNVWLTHSVPPHSVVQHESEVVVRSKHEASGGSAD